MQRSKQQAPRPTMQWHDDRPDCAKIFETKTFTIITTRTVTVRDLQALT
jgi:hypothetical protein